MNPEEKPLSNDVTSTMKIPYKTILTAALILLSVALIYSMSVRPVDKQDTWMKKDDMRWLHDYLEANKKQQKIPVNQGMYRDRPTNIDKGWPYAGPYNKDPLDSRHDWLDNNRDIQQPAPGYRAAAYNKPYNTQPLQDQFRGFEDLPNLGVVNKPNILPIQQNWQPEGRLFDNRNDDDGDDDDYDDDDDDSSWTDDAMNWPTASESQEFETAESLLSSSFSPQIQSTRSSLETVDNTMINRIKANVAPYLDLSESESIMKDDVNQKQLLETQIPKPYIYNDNRETAVKNKIEQDKKYIWTNALNKSQEFVNGLQQNVVPEKDVGLGGLRPIDERNQPINRLAEKDQTPWQGKPIPELQQLANAGNLQQNELAKSPNVQHPLFGGPQQFALRKSILLNAPETANARDKANNGIQKQKTTEEILADIPEYLVGLRQRIENVPKVLNMQPPILNNINAPVDIGHEPSVNAVVDEEKRKMEDYVKETDRRNKLIELQGLPGLNKFPTINQNNAWANGLPNNRNFMPSQGVPNELVGLKQHMELQRNVQLLARAPGQAVLTKIGWDEVVGSRADVSHECLPLHILSLFRVCIHTPEEDPEISGKLKLRSGWEFNSLRDMQLLMTSNRDLGLIDIGAGIGVYSLAAASLGRQVVAVEPFVPHIQAFQHSVQQNNFRDLIQLYRNVISDDHSLVTISQTPGKDINHIDIKPVEGSTGDKEIVKTATLDDIAGVCPFKTAVLKIDAPGSMYTALKVSTNLFSKLNITHVFMHWHVEDPYLSKYVAPMFSDMGFKPYEDLFKQQLSLSETNTWKDQRIIWKKE